jgi:hypothetical protein
MAQLFGMAGLLLVPLGLLWLIHELSKRRKNDWKPINKNRTYHFAISAVVASYIVAIAISLGAFGNNNRFLGIVTLVFCIYIVLKIIPKLKQLKNAEKVPFNPIPFYFIIIPIIVALIRFMFIVPATEFSRNYAIKQSGRLIQDIEAYQKKMDITQYPYRLFIVIIHHL